MTPSCSPSPTPASAFPPPISRASSSVSTAWMRSVPAKPAAPDSASRSPSTSSRSTAGGYGSRAKSALAPAFIFPSRSLIPGADRPVRHRPPPAVAQAVPILPQTPSSLLFDLFIPLSHRRNVFNASYLQRAQVCRTKLLTRRFRMTPAAGLTEAVLYDTLVNYLISMARVVESAMNRALDAIIAFDNPRTSALPGEVFLLAPRINEMEIMIDEHAIRLLRRGSFTDDEMRLVVAALKITNDLERIGDIAVNLAERVISLREMPDAKPPEELAPMVEAVRSMVSRSLGALIFRNAELAAQVLESDDVVDQYRDRIFENLLLL